MRILLRMVAIVRSASGIVENPQLSAKKALKRTENNCNMGNTDKAL